ncbi:MAG TPA: YhgE/Pip domain-containing protein, partial [Myxococcota bacterium]
IALLLLVFQMSASAGVFPVELSAGVFRFVHPWLPFTWVVQATRALLFGAYDGAWLPALARVAVFGVIAIALTALLGRWKWVPRHEFTPLLDV